MVKNDEMKKVRTTIEMIIGFLSKADLKLGTRGFPMSLLSHTRVLLLFSGLLRKHVCHLALDHIHNYSTRPLKDPYKQLRFDYGTPRIAKQPLLLTRQG